MNESTESRIESLKKNRNAIILAHNYQLPDVQDIADFTGDSLELSRKAAETDADVIVFCGVNFMAETAAMLSPEKTVLLPDEHAGCPMADMISAEQLRQLKQAHPGAVVVCYVNSSAEVKAESDYCCTSSNATAIVKSLHQAEEIIFVPDKHLGQYASQQAQRQIILWNGYCHVHTCIRESDIARALSEHPDALVMVHPECPDPVCKKADAVLSTSGMCRYAKESEAGEFIVGTETGILHRLRKENPEKKFYPASEAAVCPNMKLTTVEKVLWSLESMQYQVKVSDEIRSRAIKAIENMINTAV
ncbi:MAG: quinolinate synthase NadA [Planctomycetota bacterium]|nr:quinolinate synthase NadA [Planctomycetota bacterium]